MQKVWAFLRIIVIVFLVLLFARNTHPVTFYLYLGYSSTLPFFLWLAIFTVSGIVLGYMAARVQFWNGRRRSSSASINEVDGSHGGSMAPVHIPSLVDAIRAVPASPKGEDEHGHYGI